MAQPVTHPEWGGNQLSFASGQLGESEKPVEVMDSNNGDG